MNGLLTARFRSLRSPLKPGGSVVGPCEEDINLGQPESRFSALAGRGRTPFPERAKDRCLTQERGMLFLRRQREPARRLVVSVNGRDRRGVFGPKIERGHADIDEVR